MSLQADVDAFLQSASGPAELYPLIGRCIDQGGAEGLAALRKLAEDDYGGMTFKFELRHPAATSLLLFGENGLRELAEIARAHLQGRRAIMAMELLASISAGSSQAPLS